MIFDPHEMKNRANYPEWGAILRGLRQQGDTEPIKHLKP